MGLQKIKAEIYSEFPVVTNTRLSGNHRMLCVSQDFQPLSYNYDTSPKNWGVKHLPMHYKKIKKEVQILVGHHFKANIWGKKIRHSPIFNRKLFSNLFIFHDKWYLPQHSLTRKKFQPKSKCIWMLNSVLIFSNKV